MRIIPFKAEHVERMSLQAAQEYLRPWVKIDELSTLEGPWAYSAVEGEEVLVCAGIAPVWGSRGVAWAYLAKEAGRAMVAITRAVRRGLDACPYDRVEITVDCEFEAGHRWARLLGFELEASRLRKARPDGGDSALYARVR